MEKMPERVYIKEAMGGDGFCLYMEGEYMPSECTEYICADAVVKKEAFIRDVECLIDTYITDIDERIIPLAMRWLAEKLYDRFKIYRKEK